MEEQKFEDFISNIKKVKESRVHKIKNSYGIIDGYKLYSRIKPKESKYNININQYRKITRLVNSYMLDSLLDDGEIIFPCALGRLEIRKFKPEVKMVGDKIINSMPIDWDQTLKLWHQDEESKLEKRLVRKLEKWIYRIYYNRGKANYSNKSFIRFQTNRKLKLQIRDKINNNALEAFIIH